MDKEKASIISISICLVALTVFSFVTVNSTIPKTRTVIIPSITVTMPTQEPTGAITPPTVEQSYEFTEEYTITAYCPCRKCCGKTDGITATGIKAIEGITIAADWNILPPGTIVTIEGIGKRTVQDKGGAVKGKHIDLFFSSHKQALDFGTQKRLVTITKGDK